MTHADQPAVPGREDVPRPKRKPHNPALSITVEALGILVQVYLVYLGIVYALVEDEELAEYGRLAGWCLVATLYLVGTVLWLNIDLRLHAHDHQAVRRLSSIAVFRWLSLIVTFSSSFVGLIAAVTLIFSKSDPDHNTIFDLVAVWAMLVSWAMFHWGYARIYYSRYHKHESERPLRFPGTDEPRLVDFVYFSFTNGTSFAPSDVQVATTRMRWTVVWHTTLSFFFNAMIIVLTMNTIAGGFIDL